MVAQQGGGNGARHNADLNADTVLHRHGPEVNSDGRLMRAADCASMTRRDLDAVFASLGADELHALDHDWDFWAHAHQRPPDGAWWAWLVLGGRGAGKTRAGAEWVRAAAEGLGALGVAPRRRIGLVGQSLNDVREIMIEGPSGLRAIAPRHRREQGPRLHRWGRVRSRCRGCRAGVVARSVFRRRTRLSLRCGACLEPGWDRRRGRSGCERGGHTGS